MTAINTCAQLLFFSFLLGVVRVNGETCRNITTSPACHARSDCVYDVYLGACFNSLSEVSAEWPCSHWSNTTQRSAACVYHGCEMVDSVCENATEALVAAEHVRRTRVAQHGCADGHVSLEYDVRLQFHQPLNSSHCTGPHSLRDITTPNHTCYGDTPVSVSGCTCFNDMCRVDVAFETKCRSLLANGQTFNLCKTHRFFVDVLTCPLGHNTTTTTATTECAQLRRREPVEVRISLAVSKSTPVFSSSLLLATDALTIVTPTNLPDEYMESASTPAIAYIATFASGVVYQFVLGYFLVSVFVTSMSKARKTNGGSATTPIANSSNTTLNALTNGNKYSGRGMYNRAHAISLNGY